MSDANKKDLSALSCVRQGARDLIAITKDTRGVLAHLLFGESISLMVY